MLYSIHLTASLSDRQTAWISDRQTAWISEAEICSIFDSHFKFTINRRLYVVKGIKEYQNLFKFLRNTVVEIFVTHLSPQNVVLYFWVTPYFDFVWSLEYYCYNEQQLIVILVEPLQ